MSKDRRKAIERVAAFWRRFSAYVEEAAEGETRLSLVILLTAIIPDLPLKAYDTIEERLVKVLDKGGTCRKPRPD